MKTYNCSTKIKESEKINGMFITRIRWTYSDSSMNCNRYIVSNVEIDIFNVNSQLFSETTFKTYKRALKFAKNSK